MKSQHSSNKTTRSVVFLGIFFVMAAWALPAMAEVPVSITQQGRIMDGDEPMTDTQTLEFALYDAASDGNLLWSDVIEQDLGDDGIYTAVLGGEDNPIDATVLQDGEVYLQLSVNDDAFGDRLELTSVPFAAMADSARVSQSVVDGGVTADAIADGAVGSSALADGAVGSSALAEGSVGTDQIDSVDWERLTGIPDEIIEPTDTLADLDCDADHVAVYDGSQWHCATQQDTTYSAGSGLELNDGQFSVADNRFLACDDASSSCPAGVEDGIYLDGDTSGDFLIYADDDGPVGMDDSIGIAGNLGVEGQTHFDDRIGIHTTNSEGPQFPLHIRQELSYNTRNAAIAMIRGNGDEAWTVGTSAATRNFHFRYSDNLTGNNNNTDLKAWITPDDGEFHSLSDINLKTDIEYIDSLLDDVMKLKPATYRFKTQDRNDRSYGFIAQEVAELFPEFVSKEEEHYGISYQNFGVLAIQAIQEQQAIIDEQSAEVDALRREIEAADELRQQVDDLERRLDAFEANP